jgi:hypothetical protein
VNRPLSAPEVERAQDLLAARATEGVTDAEAAELAALGVHEDASFELAAAAIDLAMLRVSPMPAALAEKLVGQGEHALRTSGLVAPAASGLANPLMPGSMPTIAGVAPAFGASQPVSPAGASGPVVGYVAPVQQLPRPASPSSPPIGAPASVTPITAAKRSRAPLVVAWTMATVGIAAAATTIIYVRTQPPKIETVTKVEYRDVVKMPQTPSPLAARAELLATATDVKTLAWTATKDAAAAGASGDVVWSPSQQKGYMRFVGLAPNDPTKTQYQLWIFDKTRDDKFPVDGGVFDVTAAGEVIVPISAKLAVVDPTLFAVTVEAPGGVVVSKRERIVVTAAPG